MVHLGLFCKYAYDLLLFCPTQHFKVPLLPCSVKHLMFFYALLCSKKPPRCVSTHRYLIKFLSKLTEHQEMNKMTPGNIAIVLGPNLLWMNNEGFVFIFTASEVQCESSKLFCCGRQPFHLFCVYLENKTLTIPTFTNIHFKMTLDRLYCLLP